MQFTTNVKVFRTGSHNSRGATGTTTLTWNLQIKYTEKNDGLESVKAVVLPQTITLHLEAFNDDTDQDDTWTEELNINEIKIDGYAIQRSGDFMKALSEGIKPGKLEIWNDQVTLSF